MGKVNAHHFSHIKGTCDPWYKDMSEWHRNWQSIFPLEKREVVLTSDGLKHIADVCLDNAIIEFQHSTITEKELTQRNKFYLGCSKKVVWVFDCYGKEIHTNHTSSIGTQIYAQSKMNTGIVTKFHWIRYKRVLKGLLGKDNLELYLHINDYYVLKIIECEDWWGFRNLTGIALTIDQFLSELSKFDESIKNCSSNGIFNNYSKKFRRKYDIENLSAWIRESNRNGYNDLKLTNEVKKIFNKYIDGVISYDEMKKILNIRYVRPSLNNTYFNYLKD